MNQPTNQHNNKKTQNKTKQNQEKIHSYQINGK